MPAHHPGYIRDPDERCRIALDSAKEKKKKKEKKTTNPPNYLQQIELLKFALRRATSSEVASNEDKFDASDAKLLESNPSFPIIRHELASGPAHPLINAFLIERSICFSFHKRDQNVQKICVRDVKYLVFYTERWEKDVAEEISSGNKIAKFQ